MISAVTDSELQMFIRKMFYSVASDKKNIAIAPLKLLQQSSGLKAVEVIGWLLIKWWFFFHSFFFFFWVLQILHFHYVKELCTTFN